MPDTKETNTKTPENQPDTEKPKKAAPAIHEQGKPETQPHAVPQPQVQKDKEPEKKSA